MAHQCAAGCGRTESSSGCSLSLANIMGRKRCANLGTVPLRQESGELFRAENVHTLPQLQALQLALSPLPAEGPIMVCTDHQDLVHATKRWKQGLGTAAAGVAAAAAVAGVAYGASRVLATPENPVLDHLREIRDKLKAAKHQAKIKTLEAIKTKMEDPDRKPWTACEKKLLQAEGILEEEPSATQSLLAEVAAKQKAQAETDYVDALGVWTGLEPTRQQACYAPCNLAGVAVGDVVQHTTNGTQYYVDAIGETGVILGPVEDGPALDVNNPDFYRHYTATPTNNAACACDELLAKYRRILIERHPEWPWTGRGAPGWSQWARDKSQEAWASGKRAMGASAAQKRACRELFKVGKQASYAEIEAGYTAVPMAGRSSHGQTREECRQALLGYTGQAAVRGDRALGAVGLSAAQRQEQRDRKAQCQRFLKVDNDTSYADIETRAAAKPSGLYAAGQSPEECRDLLLGYTGRATVGLQAIHADLAKRFAHAKTVIARVPAYWTGQSAEQQQRTAHALALLPSAGTETAAGTAQGTDALLRSCVEDGQQLGLIIRPEDPFPTQEALDQARRQNRTGADQGMLDRVYTRLMTVHTQLSSGKFFTLGAVGGYLHGLWDQFLAFKRKMKIKTDWRAAGSSSTESTPEQLRAARLQRMKTKPLELVQKLARGPHNTPIDQPLVDTDLPSAYRDRDPHWGEIGHTWNNEYLSNRGHALAVNLLVYGGDHCVFTKLVPGKLWGTNACRAEHTNKEVTAFLDRLGGTMDISQLKSGEAVIYTNPSGAVEYGTLNVHGNGNKPDSILLKSNDATVFLKNLVVTSTVRPGASDPESPEGQKSRQPSKRVSKKVEDIVNTLSPMSEDLDRMPGGWFAECANDLRSILRDFRDALHEMHGVESWDER